MKKDTILKLFVTVRGSPGRKPRLPREPRLTVWEPLAYTLKCVLWKQISSISQSDHIQTIPTHWSCSHVHV